MKRLLTVITPLTAIAFSGAVYASAFDEHAKEWNTDLSEQPAGVMMDKLERYELRTVTPYQIIFNETEIRYPDVNQLGDPFIIREQLCEPGNWVLSSCIWLTVGQTYSLKSTDADNYYQVKDSSGLLETLFLYDPSLRSHRSEGYTAGFYSSLTTQPPQGNVYLHAEVVSDYFDGHRGPETSVMATYRVSPGVTVAFTLYEQFFDESQWRVVDSQTVTHKTTFDNVNLSHTASRQIPAWYRLEMQRVSGHTNDHSPFIELKHVQVIGEKCTQIGLGCIPQF
ncbi:MAG: hypothetical protein AAGB12_06655 [Pseudomonadota bacterium]